MNAHDPSSLTHLTHRIYQCEQPDCRFRFPVLERIMDSCPRCGASLQLCQSWQASSKVDETPVTSEQKQVQQFQLPHIELLLDNVRSAYNVGSIFRTANAAGVRHLHLCGMTATPEHPKVGKTALGAEQMIPWCYHCNGLDGAAALKESGKMLWALEKCSGSASLFDIDYTYIQSPIVLIVGNETSGIDPGIIELCDRVLHIPMQGEKRSLNVTIALGVAAYFVTTQAWNR